MASTNGEDNRRPTNERPEASELLAAETPILQSTETDDSSCRAPADEPHSTGSWRQEVGTAMDSVSDVINDNIVAARYATIASIALLSAYGLANTPLFFRFKTVSEIPGTLRVRNHNLNQAQGTGRMHLWSAWLIFFYCPYPTASYFLRRRTIHGRLIRVVDNVASAKGAI
jgi:hypothetical protein